MNIMTENKLKSLKEKMAPEAYTLLKDIYNLLSPKVRKAKKKFKEDAIKYEQMNTRKQYGVEKKYYYPCLRDAEDSAGGLGSYFWQDLWAAKHIFASNPEKHCDIGSSVGSFIGHLASFRDNVTLIDIRPLENVIPGVNFKQADATNLDGIENESIESLSALCSLEHFGLGRFGDPIDPEACFKAFESIQRVMKKGGRVYISVPIGRERVWFNAHRVFYASTIVESFSSMQLKEISVIHPDENKIRENIGVHEYDDYNGRELMFGLFLFEK